MNVRATKPAVEVQRRTLADPEELTVDVEIPGDGCQHGGDHDGNDDAVVTAAQQTVPPVAIEQRLTRIRIQHTPYTGAIDEGTGHMCRECGYLHPCPTQRMASDSDPLGPWLTQIPISRHG